MEFGQNVLSLHVIGVVLGAMGAFTMGLVLSKLCANGDLTRKIYQGFRYSLKATVLGIAIAWSSMAVYISYLANNQPDALVDPLLWARVSVLVAITGLVYFIRRVVIPLAKRRVKLSIFGGLTTQQQDKMIALGAVSTVSWITMLVLSVLGTAILKLENPWLTYAGIMLVFAISLVFCVIAGKVGGKIARRRFLNRMKAKQEYYNKLVNSGPQSNYL